MPPLGARTVNKKGPGASALALRPHDATPKDDYDGDNDLSDDATDATPVKKAPSMLLKAVKARERALADKIEIVKDTIANPLEKDTGVVVDCFHLVGEKNARLEKSFDYVHMMKLMSPMPFVLVKETMLTEGPYAGHVAILMKQSVPFPLMKLPKPIRTKILNFLLKHDGDVPMTLKQAGKKLAYSPDYMGKHTLAITLSCKVLRDEAAKIVYSQNFHFPGTQVVTAFLLQIGQFRKYLVSIRSDAYNPASARTMFPLLQDARRLKRLSFAHVSSNENPKTATKNIFNDASSWLLTLDKNKPTKGLDILQFDHSAFHVRHKRKDGSVQVIQWDEGERLQFLKGLRVKLESHARRAAGS